MRISRSMMTVVPVSMLAGSVAMAATVNMGGASANLGLEHRSEFGYDMMGFNAVEGQDAPKAMSSIGNQVGFTLNGTVSDSVSYDMNIIFGTTGLNYLGNNNSFRWAYADYKAMDNLSIRAGLDYANQGGFENEGFLYDIIAPSVFMNQLPIDRTVAAVEARLDFGDEAKVNVQLYDDSIDMNADNNPNQMPAWTLEYRGDFGPVGLLAQYGSIDAMNSNFYSVGLNLSVGDLSAYLDYNMVNDTTVVTGADDATATNARSSIVADLRYTMDKVQYFVKYSMYDVAQDTTDLAGNAPGAAMDPATRFADNGTILSAGIRCQWLDSYHPYLAYVMESGRYLEAAGGDVTETKSNSSVLFGVMGKI